MDDFEAIRQLKARYCRFLDTKDYEAWKRLFADDVVVKLDMAISTGGVYTEGPSKQFDFTEPYLRTVLGFLGMTDISTVRAEGVKLEGNRERAIEAALNSIPMAVDQSGSPGSRVGIA